ncbi:MAG: FAD-dependent oxidoreductase [Leptolyngbya sp. SIO1D8]|nr:FAD-dependent oxidoreductase [Leptolyngbya sp. SIO1D8]
MKTETLTADVLVVGGGTGGTSAAIQAARRGAKTILVSEFPWLGGMLTTAGVSAPDGNELAAFQTGLWGAFLQALKRQQPGGLENAWVSFFTYEPKVGAAIFAHWVKSLPNLQWLVGQIPKEVLRQGDRILGVRFDDITVHASITVDGTELGDLLALGNVPYRWGWEDHATFSEPSAPKSLTDPEDPLHDIVQTYPVQAPTWVVILQDVGEDNIAPKISSTAAYASSSFQGAWEGYGTETFLNYGRLPNHQFMLNWPQQGNDYGVNLQRLVQGASAWKAWATEAIAHSQDFAHFIQSELGDRYGLAKDAFPKISGQLGGGAFALHPYYRESRRLVGMTTVTELDILPQTGGSVAALPINANGEMSAIAIGNYPNDHHYPGFVMPLAPKSLHWGGRWTGTPFALPYEALVPASIEGFLACDKNISVSHIANGATRLQPVVLGLGQAAGMAAALCVEQGCQPHSLSIQALQTALINDPDAPAAIIPLFDVVPQDANWRTRQYHYQKHPKQYSISGNENISSSQYSAFSQTDSDLTSSFQGLFKVEMKGETWQAQIQLSESQQMSLIALHPNVYKQLQELKNNQKITVLGIPNWAAQWLQAIKIV